jgi:hypothetical protein
MKSIIVLIICIAASLSLPKASAAPQGSPVAGVAQLAANPSAPGQQKKDDVAAAKNDKDPKSKKDKDNKNDDKDNDPNDGNAGKGNDNK